MKTINVERFIRKLEDLAENATEKRDNCEDSKSMEAAHWHTVSVALQAVIQAAKDSSETAFTVLS